MECKHKFVKVKTIGEKKITYQCLICGLVLNNTKEINKIRRKVYG